MGRNTQVNGLGAIEMAMEFKCGLINQGTKGIGKMIKRMGKELSFTLMETCMLGSGEMIRLMGLANILMIMELLTRETGEKINNTGGEQRPGQTALNTWGSMKMGRNMVKGFFILLIKVFMKDYSRTMKFLVSESTLGMTVKGLKENGKTIKWTGEEL